MNRSHTRRGRRWRLPYLMLTVVLTAPLVVTALPAGADDGPMVRKNIAKTPDLESDHAQLSMMQFYVPATKADGSLTEIEYYNDTDGDNQPNDLLFTRAYAKPLIVTYQDELAPGGAYDILTGEEVGPDIRRDTFAAMSLDDGETWKDTNLSESADASSFTLANEIEYPGDVTEIVHAVAGNQILVAWTSKYCAQGSPRYSLTDELDVDGDGDVEERLYEDMFGVSGNQRSIDYAEWMHHGGYPFAAVGEIPYSCVWTARGTVEHLPPGGGSGLTEDVWGVRWRKAERLTSGRRDAYKLSIDGAEGAGFALSWQEDPEGLRPGYGEGPGTGWSGATAHHKTDIWYSSIGFDDFTAVEDPATPGVPAVDPDMLETGKPKVFEPMAMPVRLTDNDKCELDILTGLPKTSEDGKITQPWCYDLDEGDGVPDAAGTTVDADPDGIGDLCPVRYVGDPEVKIGDRLATDYEVVDDTRVITTYNATGKQMDICISDDGRLLNGQTASTRARLVMEGYDQDGDGTNDSAWVVVMHEESKGLGAGHPGEDEFTAVELDQGKDAMYHTFDLFQPDQAAAGHMLNLPEKASPWILDQLAEGTNPKWTNWPDPPEAIGDTWLVPNDLSVALSGGDMESAELNQYNTPIARRGSFMLNTLARMGAEAYREGMTSAVLLYKQGSPRQGGPSDIMMRRTVLPAGFSPATDNPFAVEYLACDAFEASPEVDGFLTYPLTDYPFGLCVDDGPANLSSVTPLTSEPLDNADAKHGIHDRILTWDQSQEGTQVDDGYTFTDAFSVGIHDNRYDEDWTNPYDVGKGHRGFIDGDFVMVMYGWSPNWLATSHGHEPYNLFIRRSFDGGVTWTTTPAELGGDGTTYDQAHGVGDRTWEETRTLGAGEFEPARNVSQITTSKETILDPRYSPTNIGTQADVTRILQEDGTYADAGDLADVRDPSKFAVVYETGDATVVLTGGEADPWDLFASRATEYGDEWASEDVFAQGRGVWEERWDWVENKDDTRAGESSIAMSPDGQFAWIVWNEWIEHETDTNGDGNTDVTDADPMFRRLWWDDANLDPVADAGGLYETDGAAIVTLEGSATDPDGDEIVSLRWDLDMDGVFETDGAEVHFPATGAPQGVALQACDSAGNCDVDMTWVNRPHPFIPRVWRLQAEPEPATVGSTVELSGKFNAPGTATVASVMWDFGDGSPMVEATLPAEEQGKGAAFATGSHAYTEQGIYTVTLTVTDSEGRVGHDTLYVPVHDPSDKRFVVGEGELLSPVDALIGSGTADTLYVALDAKRHPVTRAPIGTVTLQLADAGLGFEATSIDWLVIEPDGTAFIKGLGELDGVGGYEYLVSLNDGGRRGTDTLRARVWGTGAGKNGAVVYDSQVLAPLGADPIGPLTAGNLTLMLR
jgi:hypothetical protein